MQQQQQPETAAAPLPLLGWQELRQRLLDAGANPAYASQAWAKNHHRWVVWKLARLQLLRTPATSSSDAGNGSSSSGGSKGQAQLLTAAVVLDELKYRCCPAACIFCPAQESLACITMRCTI